VAKYPSHRNNSNSRYSNHTFSTGHTFDTITDIHATDIIRTRKKEKHVNTFTKSVRIIYISTMHIILYSNIVQTAHKIKAHTLQYRYIRVEQETTLTQPQVQGIIYQGNMYAETGK
jgi:hypothetical protein